MGDHAEDEIYKEMHGCYPWEEDALSFHNLGTNKRNVKQQGKVEWAGIRKFVKHKNSLTNQDARNVAVKYCIEELGWEVTEAHTSNNHKVGNHISRDFGRFARWWKTHKKKK